LQSDGKIIFVFIFREKKIADLKGHFADIDIGNVSGAKMIYLMKVKLNEKNYLKKLTDEGNIC
jgi:hypothetical protein